jgi:hypothetical protein
LIGNRLPAGRRLYLRNTSLAEDRLFSFDHRIFFGILGTHSFRCLEEADKPVFPMIVATLRIEVLP